MLVFSFSESCLYILRDLSKPFCRCCCVCYFFQFQFQFTFSVIFVIKNSSMACRILWRCFTCPGWPMVNQAWQYSMTAFSTVPSRFYESWELVLGVTPNSTRLTVCRLEGVSRCNLISLTKCNWPVHLVVGSLNISL